MRQAGDKSKANRVSNGRHDDRDRAGGLLGGTGRIISRGNDAVHLETNQLRGEFRKSIYVPFCRSILNDNVFTFDVTKLAQSLVEGIEPG